MLICDSLACVLSLFYLPCVWFCVQWRCVWISFLQSFWVKWINNISLSVCVRVDLFLWMKSCMWVWMQHAPLGHLSVILQWLSFFFYQKKGFVWSVRKERYTIGKSGLKHQERQNSQSWAHKLHWCGIIRSFAFGASLLPVLRSSSLIIYLILSWPPNCTEFGRSPLCCTLYFFLIRLCCHLCLVVDLHAL